MDKDKLVEHYEYLLRKFCDPYEVQKCPTCDIYFQLESLHGCYNDVECERRCIFCRLVKKCSVCSRDWCCDQCTESCEKPGCSYVICEDCQEELGTLEHVCPLPINV